MSYSIDLYRRKIPVERDLLRFATFVAFFPQLVAGPIVRAAEFLPLLQADHRFDWDRLNLGLSRVLVGMFKKVAVADTLALFVDRVFDSPEVMGSLTLIVGIVFYAFQIYCDFSGYSDIAIGLAEMLGFDFPENFRTPYFSRGFSEFWTRWHISLSSWLRDYLYIPLGGNRQGAARTYRNLMITMLLGGLWHGANWTFVFWGALHGGFLVLERLVGRPAAVVMTRVGVPRLLLSAAQLSLTFLLTCLAWVFFRCGTFEQAIVVLQGIAELDDLSLGAIPHKVHFAKGAAAICLLLTGDIVGVWAPLREWVVTYTAFRIAAFATLLWLISALGTFGGDQFIYFQF